MVHSRPHYCLGELKGSSMVVVVVVVGLGGLTIWNSVCFACESLALQD